MARINSLNSGFAGFQSITASTKEEPEYDGVIMAFAQAYAPIGWTKQSTYNDYAIRVVSGTPGSGGSVNHSSVFTTQIPFTPYSGPFPLPVGVTTITTSTMQGHSHSMGFGAAGGSLKGGSPSTAPYYTGPYSNAGTTGPLTSVSTGSGGGHAHTASVTSVTLSSSLNMAVKYMDVILAKY